MLTLAGHQRVDGVDALRLTFRESLIALRPGHPTRTIVIHGALWVDHRSYLPVRLRESAEHRWFRDDFRWLVPTRAHPALLTLRVPRGYRHVPPPRRHGRDQALSGW